jgi:hypothetical protein
MMHACRPVGPVSVPAGPWTPSVLEHDTLGGNHLVA